MVKHALKILGSVTVGMTALTVKMNITVQVRYKYNESNNIFICPGFFEWEQYNCSRSLE